MRTVSDFSALLSGHSWTDGTPGTPVFVTYSFPTQEPGYQRSEFGYSRFEALSKTEQRLAERALEAWENVSGIHFLKVSPGKGDINFSAYDFNRLGLDGISALTQVPGQRGQEYSGDIFIDSTENISFGVFLHEVGHAIGLKHPFEANYLNDKILASQFDNSNYTVMSYNHVGAVTGPARLDIQAASYLYGAARLDGTKAASWSWNSRTETLTQNGRAVSETLLGTSTQDRINGNSGHDTLYGLDGADTLSGGAGRDLLIGGPGGDLLHGGDGFDVVSYQGDTDAFGYGVRASLNQSTGGRGASGDRYVSIEGLIGSSSDDSLSGDAGNNLLRGGGSGGSGDRLTGGAGADRFVFSEKLYTEGVDDFWINVSTITDFKSDDSIELENEIFSALTKVGALSVGAFKNLARGSVDASDRILFVSKKGDLNGYLYYDADGSGQAKQPLLFAALENIRSVDASDFVVI